MKKGIMALALTLIIAFSALSLAGAADFTFTDVPTYHKDRLAIEYCAKNGFIKGYTDTIFEPDGTLTREQFAVIWARTFHVRLHNFSDVTKVPNEFDNAIIIMQALGHVNGMSDTEFGRTSRISREQAIAITQRAYLPGNDGNDRYKDYSDYALISDWARNAISVCKEKGVLDGVFTGATLNPAQPITRGELCHLIFNIMKTEHEITVSTNIRNGTVAFTGNIRVDESTGKKTAFSGETITLTATPDANYVLVPGSLKVNGVPVTTTKAADSDVSTGTFTMPFDDVTITADFATKIESIAVKVNPNKMTYKTGEKLDLAGLVVELTYVTQGKREITGYTVSPAAGSTLNLTGGGTVNVVISYTENGVNVTTTLPITVTPA